MVRFRTERKQLLFLLIPLLYLVVSILIGSMQVFAEEEKQEGKEVYSVPPPLVYQGLYPCNACHRKDVRGVSSQVDREKSFLGKYLRAPDPRPRILVRMHRNINLKHAEWMWCLNCHNLDERNYLRLINGDTISFEESYRLCGQCHGQIYNDWKLGIHGRRVGQWSGKKLYLLCAHCHDPHGPKFRKLMAEDAPRPPSYGRWQSADLQHE
ncbi:MAG: hypothetical protein JSV14_02475 [Deltaproteobacteria bacterium]|nr:MAG: hypothetical protein JSV14_02475 [Deltaproteobacteria bacterium]